MPTYVWSCAQCGDIEVYRPIAQHRVPPEHRHPVTRVLSVPYVTPDIEPYRAVAGDRAGQYITSRREHREFLRRNSFVEVGTEPVKPIKNDFRPKKGEVAKELKEVIQPYLCASK